MNNIQRVIVLLVISGVLLIAVEPFPYWNGQWRLDEGKAMTCLAIIAAVGFFLFRAKKQP